MSVAGPRTGAGRGEGTKYTPRARVTAGLRRAKPAPPGPVTTASWGTEKGYRGVSEKKHCVIRGFMVCARRRLCLVLLVMAE